MVLRSSRFLVPGWGQETALKLVEEGLSDDMLAQFAGPLQEIAAEPGPGLFPVPTGVTDSEAVERKFGPIKCAVFNAGVFLKGAVLDFAPSEFKRAWRVGAYSGPIFGPVVARRMVTGKDATIIFSGATAFLHGNAALFGFSGSKFGLRSVARCMAR